eukprot:5419643-Pyramimonas_sp.AAC.1
MGPRSAVLRGADACDHSHWGLRSDSLWGHEALYSPGLDHVITAALRRSSPCGHETLYSGARTHVIISTGADGGAC